MYKKSKSAFTLVEMVVITMILVVLSTIGFLTLSDYPIKARDAARKSDLKKIQKSINLYRAKSWDFPTPDNPKVSSMTWWVEWSFWTGIYQLVSNMSDLPKDPKTWESYEYFLWEDWFTYKIRAKLENWEYYELWKFHTLLADWETAWGGVTWWTPTWWWGCPSWEIVYWDDCFVSVDKSCFEFTAGVITNYYDHEDNDSSNPACPRDVVIPSSIEWEAVVGVWDWAFFYSSIRSVKIPNSVTTIWNEAFASPFEWPIDVLSLNTITDIIIPNSVTSIWASAFSNNSLTNVVIPNSVTSIQEGTFAHNNLTNINIPSSITTIWRHAFKSNSLTSVTIPNSSTTCNWSTDPSFWNTFCFDSWVTVTQP